MNKIYGYIICPHILKVLKQNVEKLWPSERIVTVILLLFIKIKFRYCSILFDKICLSSGLQYTLRADEIDGFVDTGKYKSQELADHALVLMIRGIRKKTKQPIAYSFSDQSKSIRATAE